MTARLTRNADLHLADVLSEQAEQTPAGELLAEAAEDFGDRRALVKEFDRAFARAVAQERRQRFSDRLKEFAAQVLTLSSWKPVAATAATLLVLVAGGLYVTYRWGMDARTMRDAAHDAAAEPPKTAQAGGKDDCNRAQDPSLAIKACSKLIASHPDDAGAYKQRGRAYSGTGDYDRAIADFDQAIKLARDDAPSYGMRGAAYWLVGDFDRAIADANESIRLAPRDAAGYRVRGLVYVSKSESYTEAFLKSLRADFDDVIKTLDAAIADFDEAIKIAPTDEDYSGRGYLYYKKGDFARAVADLTQAIRLNPSSVAAHARRGEVCEARGERAKAIEDYNKAAALPAKAKWERDRQADARQRLAQLLGPPQVSKAESGHMLAVLTGHAFAVESLAFSPDGRRLATASGGTVRLWDVQSTYAISEFKVLFLPPITALAFGPDNAEIFTVDGNDKHVVSLRDTPEVRITYFPSFQSKVLSAVPTPEGLYVVTAADDNGVRLFKDNKEIRAFRGHDGPVTSAALSPDRKLILTTSEDKTIRVWNAATGEQVAVLGDRMSSIAYAAFSPDGRRVIAISKQDPTAHVWDVASRAQLTVLKGHTGSVLHAAFSPDGRRVITASADGTARLWNAGSGEAIAVLVGHAGPVTSVAFSPDGSLVATASQDKTARLWKAESVVSAR